ncbi:MAG TPA: hypothetical protein VGW75_08290 [Solirubrobacteraceae bacterium]|nr:hypothetical protein [Solirubrobacteraceae bacterium]
MAFRIDSPYSLEPTENERLLRLRRFELTMLEEAVSGEDGCGHALLCGPARSGRTSTLREAGRRAAANLSRLVVDLRLIDDDLTTNGLQRAMLTAIAEAIAGQSAPTPDWYRAWCDRVLLRDRSPTSVRDSLISGLAFATDPAAVIDPALFERDLRELVRLARERGHTAIVVCIDNADGLLEDVPLTERMVDSFDAAGGLSLLMSCRPSGRQHLLEAVSPCLRRLLMIPVLPLAMPDDVRVCLTAPLDSAEVERLMPDKREHAAALQRDIANFTQGNAFEIALVAQQMWWACRTGEQDVYKLTPRVLERTLDDLAFYTGIDESVEAGAAAARELPPEQLRGALELVSMERLIPRQIAISRAIEAAAPDSLEKLCSCDLATAERRVLEELQALADAGVVVLEEDGSFTVVGGRITALTLQHEARSHAGVDAPEVAFGVPIAARAGAPLARELARRARGQLSGTALRADFPLLTQIGTARGARMRAALSAQKVESLDVELLALDEAGVDEIATQLADSSHPRIALVNLTLRIDGDELDWVELWDLPVDVEQYHILQALSDELDGWQPLIQAAGIAWRGSIVAVFEGPQARRALISLVPAAGHAGVLRLFERWTRTNDREVLDRAVALAEEAAGALRDHGAPRWERGWDVSSMLSVVGFLNSLYEDRRDVARAALEEACERGPGDRWVTFWNLANLAARDGDLKLARQRFERLRPRLEEWNNVAHVAMFVPQRPAAASLVVLTGENALPLLEMQLAVLDFLDPNVLTDESIERAVAACAESADESAQLVAEWVAPALDVLRRTPDASD